MLTQQFIVHLHLTTKTCQNKKHFFTVQTIKTKLVVLVCNTSGQTNRQTNRHGKPYTSRVHTSHVPGCSKHLNAYLIVYRVFTSGLWYIILHYTSECDLIPHFPQPAVTIANGVDGSADAYIFSYNGGSQSVVPNGQCTGGTCTDVFTPPDPPESQYSFSVTARNAVGEGPPDTARLISKSWN